MKKKILFLIQDEMLPSSRVRVLNLLNGLKAKGFECTVRKYPSQFSQKFEIYLLARKHHIVFLQKRLLSPIDTFLLRQNSKYLVYDFDDAVYCKQHAEFVDSKNSRFRKFKAIAKSVDLIIAGNSVLAEAATKYNQNVEILPSAVFVKNVPQKNYDFSSEQVVIGWVGGKVNLPYLALLKPVLGRLSLQYPILLRIICDETIKLDGVKVDFVPWSINTQDAEIAKFDIGLMPLEDSVHARGKCGYKALQYMAAAVPPVVSNVGINANIVKHGKLGLVANSINDFESALESLIIDREKRRQMGELAREEVLKHYSVEVVSEKLATILGST